MNRDQLATKLREILQEVKNTSMSVIDDDSFPRKIAVDITDALTLAQIDQAEIDSIADFVEHRANIPLPLGKRYEEFPQIQEISVVFYNNLEKVLKNYL